MKNKTGKAITMLIMCIVLCTCAYILSGCGDDFDYDYPYGNGNVKICAEHTGFGTCSVCGIDYYDALTGYIKNNGEYIDGNYVLGTKVENVILLIIYDYSDNGVTIGNTTANSDAEACGQPREKVSPGKKARQRNFPGRSGFENPRAVFEPRVHNGRQHRTTPITVFEKKR